MSVPQTLLQEVVHLRARVEDLERELADVRRAPDERLLRLKRHFGLQPMRAKMLLCFAAGGTLSTAALAARCMKPDSDLDAVRVHVSRLRKQIAPLRIECAHTFGYWVHRDDLDALRAIVEGRQ